VVGSCEHGNEPSGSVKCWEVAAQLADSEVGLSSMKSARRAWAMYGRRPVAHGAELSSERCFGPGGRIQQS
jgi:hypothetical protein